MRSLHRRVRRVEPRGRGIPEQADRDPDRRGQDLDLDRQTIITAIRIRGRQIRRKRKIVAEAGVGRTPRRHLPRNHRVSLISTTFISSTRPILNSIRTH